MDFVQNLNFSYRCVFTEIMDSFRKGLVYGFCPKIEISLNAVFYRNYVRKKNRFSIFWIENNHFKTKKLKF